jgi:threonine/homoserine/homoserine lactone efflux protein
VPLLAHFSTIICSPADSPDRRCQGFEHDKAGDRPVRRQPYLLGALGNLWVRAPSRLMLMAAALILIASGLAGDAVGRARTFKTIDARPPHMEAMDGLPGFLIAAIALAGSPGPATLSLAAAGAAFGAWRVAGYLAGIVVGMVVVMAITASGVVSLLLALPGVAPVVTAAAAAYFLWLAFRIATAPPLAQEAAERRPPSFGAGFGLSLINPKGYAAMAALFSGFVLLRDRIAADAALKIVMLAIVIAVVNMAWLVSGAALTRFFRDPRTNRIVNVVFALALLASVALALLA